MRPWLNAIPPVDFGRESIDRTERRPTENRVSQVPSPEWAKSISEPTPSLNRAASSSVKHAFQTVADDLFGLGHNPVDRFPDGWNVMDEPGHNSTGPGAGVNVAVTMIFGQTPATSGMMPSNSRFAPRVSSFSSRRTAALTSTRSVLRRAHMIRRVSRSELRQWPSSLCRAPYCFSLGTRRLPSR